MEVFCLQVVFSFFECFLWYESMFSVDELTDLEENTPEFAAATFVMALKKMGLRFLREISILFSLLMTARLMQRQKQRHAN